MLTRRVDDLSKHLQALANPQSRDALSWLPTTLERKFQVGGLSAIRGSVSTTGEETC